MPITAKKESIMNILLSSYSGSPYKGSEDAVGWNWITTLSKKLPNDTVYFVTRTFNKEDLDKGLKEFQIKNVKAIYVDVPNALDWYREKYKPFHYMQYMIWLQVVYRWAKKSKIKFDIVHHITMGNFRITGSINKLDAVSIFGPVGGGQTTPSSLKCYYNKKSRFEKIRDIANDLVPKMPSYKRSLRRFDKVFAVNEETKQIMEKSAGIKVVRLPEIAINKDLVMLDVEPRHNETIEIIYLGRLLELKGLTLLIDVIKEVKSDKSFHFSLYGSGELEEELKRKIKEYAIEDIVCVPGEIDYTQIADVYKSADIFVHPTFRDSGGAVFVEAMAYKLPIVALNQSLSRELNDNKCGLFVETNQAKEEIIQEFAQKLKTLIENEELRLELGENGYNYANDFLTLDKKFDIIYGDIIG